MTSNPTHTNTMYAQGDTSVIWNMAQITIPASSMLTYEDRNPAFNWVSFDMPRNPSKKKNLYSQCHLWTVIATSASTSNGLTSQLDIRSK
jgi:hypothetical protein